jgi:nitric oxide reductase subunit B
MHMNYKRLWTALILVIIGSFLVLGYFGYEIYMQAPPVPNRVVSTDGQVLFTGDDIRTGQQVWQSIGGQEVGSVWGHGAYIAPDWSADFLHRDARSSSGSGGRPMPSRSPRQANKPPEEKRRSNKLHCESG